MLSFIAGLVCVSVIFTGYLLDLVCVSVIFTGYLLESYFPDKMDFLYRFLVPIFVTLVLSIVVLLLLGL